MKELHNEVMTKLTKAQATLDSMPSHVMLDHQMFELISGLMTMLYRMERYLEDLHEEALANEVNALLVYAERKFFPNK